MISDGSSSFSYDCAGRRVSKTTATGTTFYLYDGANLIAELDGNGNVVTAYTWGPGGLISDRIGIGGTNPTSRFYQFDAFGNTRALLDASGSVLSRGAYTAWGSSYGAAINSPFGWMGRWGIYSDSDTGLARCGARYYCPATGRFISRDPTGFSCGPNMYAYCLDDPVDLVDANGMDPFWIEAGEQVDGGLAIIAWIGGIVGGASPIAELTGHDSITALLNGPPTPPTQNLANVASAYDVQKASKASVILALINWDVSIGGAAMMVGGGADGGFGEPEDDWTFGPGESLNDSPLPDGLGEDTIIYRGVPKGTPRYGDALNGNAFPRGNDVSDGTLLAHVEAEDAPDSGVTSWTPFREIAKTFSLDDGIILEIRLGDVLDQIVNGPKVEGLSHEGEILLRGNVTGATPTAP